MPGAEHEDVAFAQPDALSLLDRFQLGPGHRLTRLQPPDPAVPGHVQQHAPADQPVAVRGDVEPGRAA
jgi:hypothetical protein